MDYREVLRRLAIGDTSVLEDDKLTGTAISELDLKTRSFARLGASVALGASPSGYQDHVNAALAAGATIAEVVGVLIAIAPTVGHTKIVQAAPALGLAVGYDPEIALETLDPDEI